MADNPYPTDSRKPYWAKGYNSGQADGAGMFAKPGPDIPDSMKDVFKEGFQAGKADAKQGLYMEQDTSDGIESAPPVATNPPAAAAGGGAKAWNFEIDGHKFDHVSTEGAQAAIKKIVEGLRGRVELDSGWQSEWHKCAPSKIVNWIIETAPGGKYEPSAAVWATLQKQLNDVDSAASSGNIADAAAKAQAASAAVSTAVANWHSFLDHFEEGGNSVIDGLGEVVKLSIKVEFIAIDVASDGAASTALAAGDGGLEEMVGQWVEQSEGKRKELDWAKIGEEAVFSAIMSKATSGLSKQWEEAVANKAPGLVGMKTSLLERIGGQFINSDTGAKYTAEEMAKLLQPAWGKVVEKLTWEPLQKVIEAIVKAGAAHSADAMATAIASGLDDSAWEAAIEAVLAEEHLQRA